MTGIAGLDAMESHRYKVNIPSRAQEPAMLTHKQVWAAIDALAASNDLSASGLAKRAGLDSTAFNKSKRFSTDGRPRWPSTESLAKVMAATNASLEDFMQLLVLKPARAARENRAIPLLGLAEAGAGGYFDDAGFPAGSGLEMIDFPANLPDGVYALEVHGDSMLPVYRNADRLIVQPGGSLRTGDRVVVRTRSGEVMAKVLQRRSAHAVELASFNPDHPDREFPVNEIDWIARILWVSQ